DSGGARFRPALGIVSNCCWLSCSTIKVVNRMLCTRRSIPWTTCYTEKGYTMTNEQLETIRQLRAEGFAVIVWAPEELGTADPRRVEARSIELGNEVIEALQD